jgi:DNA replication protein DnaD
MQLNTAAKQIQTRLSKSKQSVKKSLSEIRDFLDNKKDVTEEEVNNAVSFFLNIPGELVIFNAREKALEISKTYFLDLTPTQLTALEALTSEDEIREEIYELINQESKKEEENKGELIKSAAQEMGVTLTPEEITQVAQDINATSDSIEETLEVIKAAVINFINYKVQSNSQKITSAMEEITQVAMEGLDRNSQELKSGLSGVNSLLKRRATDFKRLSQAFRISA